MVNLDFSINRQGEIVRFQLNDNFWKDVNVINKWDTFVEVGYEVLLDDLNIALTNIIREKPQLKDFSAWLESVQNIYYENISYECDDGEFFSDHALCGYVIEMLNDLTEEFWDNCDLEDGESLIDVDPINRIKETVTRFIREKDMPANKRFFPDEVKFSFTDLYDEKSINHQNAENIELFRKFLDELCEKEYVQCIQKRGYCYYVGCNAYEQDWHASEADIMKYYKLTGDASAANTLGYIYYYGRCNNGVPEYDKAFRYFSIGHAHGYYESTYKLADMFSHGYGVIKSENTALSMYSQVYNSNYERFVNGEDCNFADAALRMGNCYKKEIGVFQNMRQAYTYYLQADYAIRKRLKANYYGDNVVFNGIQRELKECREYFDKPSSIVHLHPENWQSILTGGEYRVSVSCKTLKDGRTSLMAKRLPKSRHTEPADILITFPEASFCSLVNEFNVETAEKARIEIADGKNEFIFNQAEWNYETDVLKCYYDEQLTAVIYSDDFIFNVPESARKKETGKKHVFASISFPGSHRTYDYLVEGLDLLPGDRVIVKGFKGETEVEVIEVIKKDEIDVALSIEKYSKVIRKVE